MTTEITRKNRLLEEVNSKLEEKVAERTSALKDAYDENMLLTRELQARIVELEGRDRILRHLLTIHELEDTLQITLEVICQVAALEWAAVYLPEEECCDFKLVAFHGRVSRDKADIAVDNETIMQVFANGEHLLSNENNLSFLFLPVRRSQKSLAVVVAARPWRYLENAMTRDSVDKIKQFMAHIAIAITDAQMEIDLPAWDDSLDDVLRDYLK